MGRSQLHKILFLFFFSFWFVSSEAQDTLSVKISADKSKILIGEQLHLTVMAHFPSTEAMRFFHVDSIAHFEILDRQKIDTIDANHSIDLKQVLTLTSFDSGHWMIPSFDLPGDAPLSTDSMAVDVSFSKFDTTQDYHDIKDILDAAPPKKSQNWYWYAAISAVLVVLIIVLLLRKKKPVAKKQIVIDPFKQAMEGLEKLQKEDLPAKIFYTRLVDLFRIYVYEKKGIASMQKTSDDLIVQLKTLELPAEDQTRLAQALRMSDSVKFAKFESDKKENTQSLDIVRKVINEIERSTQPTPPKQS
jgi:hypothetical protein